MNSLLFMFLRNEFFQLDQNQPITHSHCVFKILPGVGAGSTAAMAECKRATSRRPSSGDVTALARALSHTDQSDSFQSQSSLYRMGASRKRRISSGQSVDSTDVNPGAEARVLVLNTGGTIGMMYHNDGKPTHPRYFVFSLQQPRIWLEVMFFFPLCQHYNLHTKIRKDTGEEHTMQPERIVWLYLGISRAVVQHRLYGRTWGLVNW